MNAPPKKPHPLRVLAGLVVVLAALALLGWLWGSFVEWPGLPAGDYCWQVPVAALGTVVAGWLGQLGLWLMGEKVKDE